MGAMSDNKFDVVIVGAGIAGAALANLLANTGLSVAIVDAGQVPMSEPSRTSEFSDIDARVLALTEASKDVFEKAGVWSAVEAKGVSPYKEMTVWDAEGTGTLSFDCADVDKNALGYIVENRVLVWALQQQLLKTSTTLFSGQRLQAIAYQNGAVTIDLEGGLQLSAQLLVGADGAASMVRVAMGGDCHIIDNKQKAIVCHIETQRNHGDMARQRFLSTGPLALLPVADVGENVSSIVWSCDTDYADELLALSDTEFCERLSAAAESVLGDVLAATPRLAFPLVARHAVDYTAANTVLIGDAAHVVHPLAGQGINLGLSDVAVLAEQLTKAVAKGLRVSNVRALAAYQRHRRGDNLRMIALTQTFRHLFSGDALPVRWIRNFGMNTVDGQPALKRAIIKQAMGL